MVKRQVHMNKPAKITLMIIGILLGYQILALFGGR